MLIAVALAALSTSCGPARQTAYPVSGKVFAGKEKKPAEGVVVVFYPITPLDGAPVVPTGQVDHYGDYTLTTYSPSDGAPAGEYAITLKWPRAKKNNFDWAADDQLKGAYHNPEKSKLPNFTVQIVGTNEVPTIVLP
jgi:hypothetical protein